MLRDISIYLDDILNAIELINEFTYGYNQNSFKKDKKTHHAVIRNLEIIGEAVKKIPEEKRKLKTDIEWKKISGLRDILTHDYFGIDLEIVWNIVKEKLPVLKSAIEDMIKIIKTKDSSF